MGDAARTQPVPPAARLTVTGCSHDVDDEHLAIAAARDYGDQADELTAAEEKQLATVAAEAVAAGPTEGMDDSRVHQSEDRAKRQNAGSGCQATGKGVDAGAAGPLAQHDGVAVRATRFVSSSGRKAARAAAAALSMHLESGSSANSSGNEQ